MEIIDLIEEFLEEALGLILLMAILHWAGNHLLQGSSKLWRGRKLRHWLFEPVDVHRLRKETAEFFDRTAAEMEQLGFEWLADHRLARVPNRFYARFLIASDGSCFGAINDYGGMQTYDFFSVLDDGTYLETSSVTPLRDLSSGERLEIRCHPEVSVRVLYQKHQDSIRDCEQQRGGKVVKVTPDDLDAVANYGRDMIRNRRAWIPRTVIPPPCVDRGIPGMSFSGTGVA